MTKKYPHHSLLAMTCCKNPQAKRGFNLVEVAFVLGVVALVVGGIWAGYNSVSEARKTTKTVTNILSMVENTRALIGHSIFTTDNQTINLNLSMLVNSKIAPPDIPQAGGRLQHEWGGTIKVDMTNGPAGATMCNNVGRVRIFLNDLPEASCRTLIARFTALAGKNSNNLCTTYISNTADTVSTSLWSANSDSFPVLPTTPYCSAGAPALILTFPLTRQ